MKKYVKLQILKHALQYYMQREDVSEKDFAKEVHLLKEMECEIESIRDKYGLKHKTLTRNEQILNEHERDSIL